VANLLRGGISFLTGLLLARWLGPQDYGRMVFLLASFMAFRQFLDMGSSLAFFTFLSQRQRSARFVAIFGYWVGLQFLVALALVSVALPDFLIARIWVGESRSLMVLALLATFMQGTVWTIASQMAEASRETIRVQRLNTLVVLIHLGAVLALWWLSQLAIPFIFAALAAEWAVAGWVAARMYRTHDSSQAVESVPMDTPGSVWREFMAYCLPLIPYTWLGFAHDFADRWMLQNWGGAKEQAYYGVAQQFAAVALLATSSILRIFWKEIAEAHHNGDIPRVRRLYRKVSRMLYFAGAAMAGGLLPWAAEILQLTAGTAYAGGAVTLMLMFIYPVHQSMGQIGGTMLYATGHVRIQVVLGIVFMAISLVTAYFMMAPADAPIPGLAMASQGLAWKMVLLQVVGVNVTAWFVARLFDWRLDWLYQVGGLLGCVGMGWLANFLVTYHLAGLQSIIVQMAVAGIVYVGLIMALIYALPGLTGLSRLELGGYIRRWLG
jgi:O-antigen/teichoic acid export membrane protein